MLRIHGVLLVYVVKWRVPDRRELEINVPKLTGAERIYLNRQSRPGAGIRE
jgi:hypothetical protein